MMSFGRCNLFRFRLREIAAWTALSRRSVLVSRAIEGGANASAIAAILVDVNESLLKRVAELEAQRPIETLIRK